MKTDTEKKDRDSRSPDSPGAGRKSSRKKEKKDRSYSLERKEAKRERKEAKREKRHEEARLKEEEREHIKTYPDMASGGPRFPGANTYGDVDDNIPGLSMTHYYAWRHDFIELRKKWARADR